ncbi:hypothetical protein [Kribbella ginsengisoli]|uniref:Uncharacterized protein n=1 Tax=Kribbella ginsengisoli TaxID=363865 RepID=A0ABP6X5N5_9ACTN
MTDEPAADGTASDKPTPRARLDRHQLPEEFTVEALRQIDIRDLIWLQEEAELTERQRESLDAGVEEIYGPVTEKMRKATAQLAEKLAGAVKFDLPKIPKIGIEIDPIGKDLRESFARIQARSELWQREDDHRAELRHLTSENVRRSSPQAMHAEQQRSLSELHGTFQEVALMMAKLVERTEQQHEAAVRQERAAERQKTTNWALAVVAAVSMAGTLATVDSLLMFWLALIGALVVAGVLWVIMH